ncbi:MAG: WXG100 family type VII secretion target [Nocardioides sp.]
MGEGTLGKAAQLVSGAKQDFDRLGGELDGQISGLRGTWAGSGGQAFFVLHQAWTEKQKVIVSALNEFENSLLGTQKDVTSTDDTQASNFNNFQNRL